MVEIPSAGMRGIDDEEPNNQSLRSRSTPSEERREMVGRITKHYVM